MPKAKNLKWDGMNSVIRIVLVLVLLIVFGPFIMSLLCGGEANNSRIASCQSNMKQLGLALAMYSLDYDALPSQATASSKSGWREAIYPYVKSTGVYRCPDDKRVGSQDAPNNLPKSYAANHLGLGGDGKERGVFSDAQEPALSLDWKSFDHPERTISLVDSRGYNGEDWNVISPPFLPDSGRELYAHIPRHPFYEHPSGNLNCLFADGHVKRLAPMATLTPLNLWTRDNKPFQGQDLVNAQAILKHAESE